MSKYRVTTLMQPAIAMIRINGKPVEPTRVSITSESRSDCSHLLSAVLAEYAKLHCLPITDVVFTQSWKEVSNND